MYSVILLYSTRRRSFGCIIKQVGAVISLIIVTAGRLRDALRGRALLSNIMAIANQNIISI